VYLGFIEEYAKRRDDPAYFDRRGVSEAVLREVVRRAHQSGLRVSAHIETAADFPAAVAFGVDIIAHLPGLRLGSATGFADKSIDHSIISDADAASGSQEKHYRHYYRDGAEESVESEE
jgi:imidazolonepropionase-like amidohydrolase